MKCLGLPDAFITHGAISVLKEHYGLDAKGINDTIDILLKDNV